LRSGKRKAPQSKNDREAEYGLFITNTSTNTPNCQVGCGSVGPEQITPSSIGPEQLLLHDLDSLLGLTYDELYHRWSDVSLSGYVTSNTSIPSTLTTITGKHASWGSFGLGSIGERNLIFVAPKDGWYRYTNKATSINSGSRINGNRAVYVWKSSSVSSGVGFNNSTAKALQSAGAENTGFAAAISGDIYLKQGERLILNGYSNVSEERYYSIQLVRWWGEL
jgi:hypothetical protein